MGGPLTILSIMSSMMPEKKISKFMAAFRQVADDLDSSVGMGIAANFEDSSESRKEIEANGRDADLVCYICGGFRRAGTLCNLDAMSRQYIPP